MLTNQSQHNAKQQGRPKNSRAQKKSIHSAPSKNAQYKNVASNSFLSIQTPFLGLHWNQSATSLTRDNGPAFQIPKATRFATAQSQYSDNNKFTIEELSEKSQTKYGVSFAKSGRPQHFLKVKNLKSPSPASYHFSRFMDRTNYKTKDQKHTSKQSFSSNNNEQKTKDIIKGVSFTTFKNYHKSFLHHAKNKPYQPYDTIHNPGPDVYNRTWLNKKKQIRYSFRLPLRRFNEVSSIQPGPGAYQTYTKRDQSLNAKGTISKSCRTYLAKFTDTPSPNQYDIPRFLQTNKK